MIARPVRLSGRAARDADIAAIAALARRVAGPCARTSPARELEETIRALIETPDASWYVAPGPPTAGDGDTDGTRVARLVGYLGLRRTAGSVVVTTLRVLPGKGQLTHADAVIPAMLRQVLIEHGDATAFHLDVPARTAAWFEDRAGVSATRFAPFDPFTLAST